MTDHEQALQYALGGMKIKKIVWESAHNCYILTSNNIKIDIYFESPEDQIEILN